MSDAYGGTTADPQRHGGFLANVNLIFLSTLTVYVLSFLIIVAVSQFLGSEGRGVTALYQTSINLSYAFISFGVSIAALYYVSRGEVSARQALEAGLSTTVLSALLAAAAAAVLEALAGEWLSDAGVPQWFVVLAIPLVVQFRLVEVLLRSDGRFLIVSIIEAAVPFVTLAGLVALEVAGSLTVPRAILLWSLSPLPSVLAGYAALGVRAWPRGLGTWGVMRRLVSFGMQGQAGNIVQTLNYRLDSYLVALFVSSAGVGLYANGVAVSEALWLVANSVAVVLIPKLASSDPEYAARATPLVCRNTMLVTALSAVAVAAASPFAVPFVFGDEFEGSVEPLLWLLPGAVAMSGAKVLSAYVFSQGKPMLNTWISAATLALTLALDLVLIPPFGVAGAAGASTIAYCANLVLTLVAYGRISGGRPLDAVLPRLADVGLFVEGARSTLSRLRGGSKSPPASLEAG
ncbi:MAG TPA: oligosaccharide flippase family protein [Dehalococcoidia bacterium]|nr:oligosaccharide flippase family protein [Dehalococcoidia bacterium]